MNPLDELTRVLPSPPGSEELPRQQQHKTELLTIMAADRRRRRALPNRATRGWLGPAMTAAAVAAVAVLAVTVPSLVGVGSGSPSANRRVQSGHSTQATATPSATASALPPNSGLLPTTRHWSVPASRFRSVSVNVTRGLVVVTAGTGSSAAITAAPHFTGRRAPIFTGQVVDGTLSLAAACREPDCQVAITLEVPAGVAVRATTMQGDVRVTGVHGSVSVTDRSGGMVLTDLSGRVSASNIVGDVTLTGLSGPVTASTTAGTISATDLLASQVALSSQEGNISAAFAVAPAHVTASSQLGDVVLRLPSTATYDVIASTQLGSTAVTVPRSAGSGHVIKASSRLGSITVTG